MLDYRSAIDRAVRFKYPIAEAIPNFDQAITEGAKAWIGNLYGNLGHVKILKGDFKNGLRLLQPDKAISLSIRTRGSAAGALLELAKISYLAGDMLAVVLS